MGLTVDATLNVGWCGKDKKDKWVKGGDFIVDTLFKVPDEDLRKSTKNPISGPELTLVPT